VVGSCSGYMIDSCTGYVVGSCSGYVVGSCSGYVVGEIKNKARLSPARAGTWAELGNKNRKCFKETGLIGGGADVRPFQ
jgi:hypothetical protein